MRRSESRCEGQTASSAARSRESGVSSESCSAFAAALFLGQRRSVPPLDPYSVTSVPHFHLPYYQQWDQPECRCSGRYVVSLSLWPILFHVSLSD